MITLRRSGIAGEYKGTRQGASLTLRVDVGSGDSLDKVSGDLLLGSSPDQHEFHHSFQTTALVLEEQNDAQVLRGPVKVHRDNFYQIARLDLKIPDEGELLATYTLYQLTELGREVVATLNFPLTKTSGYFRRVELEVDQIQGVPLPNPFQPDAHPDLPALLTFQSVYQQAGVDLAVTFGDQDIPLNEAGPDGLWSGEELHAAMVQHFSLHQDRDQWRLYLLLATRYIRPGTLGIMFDSNDDFPRQGAAIFSEHPAIKNATGAAQAREYLYTIVHELGHAFNFLHSFQKGLFQTHGLLSRPDSLSWMNYPQLFPFGFAGPAGWNGTSSFWSQFRFLFDDDELAHVRHNDSMEVIMGGHSFGFAGHLEERPFETPTNPAKLSFTLWLPPVVEFMEQVEGDVRLRNESQEPITVHPDLHPAADMMELLVRRPNDRYPKVYRHFTKLCVGPDLQMLQRGEAIYQEISPSFGLRHWFIDEPGTYEVQAIYSGLDGSKMVSNIQKVRVLMPGPEADRLAPDFYTNDTGLYLGVEGSRIEQMSNTRDVLQEISQRIPEATIAKQVNIVNALRDVRAFKDVHRGEIIKPADRIRETNQLLKALEVTKSSKRVKIDPTQSHIRLSRHLQAAAQSYALENDENNTQAVLTTMENFLSSVNAPSQAVEEFQSFANQVSLFSK